MSTEENRAVEAQHHMAAFDTAAEAAVAGGLDFHVHSAPDVIARSGDDFEIGRAFRRAGIAGFVIKSHHAPTAARAVLVDAHLELPRVFGGVCLNHSVGGLNALAVDAAGQVGGKVVWLPTIDAANERGATVQDGDLAPSWAAIQRRVEHMGIASAPISLLDPDGKLLDRVNEILKLAREHRMVVATGHISGRESYAVAKMCKSLGVPVIVNHPEYPTIDLTVQEQRELADQNVYFERCFSTAHTGKTSWEKVFEGIAATGVERNLLASDLGQINGVDPARGLGLFAEVLLAAGFTRDGVRAMAVRNPWSLLGDEASA